MPERACCSLSLPRTFPGSVIFCFRETCGFPKLSVEVCGTVFRRFSAPLVSMPRLFLSYSKQVPAHALLEFESRFLTEGAPKRRNERMRDIKLQLWLCWLPPDAYFPAFTARVPRAARAPCCASRSVEFARSFFSVFCPLEHIFEYRLCVNNSIPVCVSNHVGKRSLSLHCQRFPSGKPILESRCPAKKAPSLRAHNTRGAAARGGSNAGCAWSVLAAF